MKQSINPEQLMELTPHQKVCLGEWWKHTGIVGDLYLEPDNFDDPFSAYTYVKVSRMGKNGDIPSLKALPLLSIGQMIELIGEKLDRISSPYGNESHIEPGQWKVWMRSGGFWDGETVELADALWDAVKESLIAPI